MWETVLRIGAEGGSLTLKGMKLKDGTWLFTRIKDESTLTEFLSAEDLESLRPILKGQSGVVTGFEHGLSLLNDSWPYLFALIVHPEFNEIIWGIVSQSDIRSTTLRRWAEVCFTDRDEASRRYTEARAARGY